MGAYIIRRLLLMIPTVFGIMAISFLITQFAPGGPVGRARRARLGIAGKLAIGWLAFVVVAALLAPVLPLEDPNETTASCVGQGPGYEGHLLGCDGIGRDVLSRMVWGARASLLLGVASVTFGLVIGGMLGLTAGYFRRRVDTVLTGAFDVLLSFPQPILALTPNPDTARRLALVWGLETRLGKEPASLEDVTEDAVASAMQYGLAQPGQRILILAGTPFGAPGAANLLRLAHAPSGPKKRK